MCVGGEGFNIAKFILIGNDIRYLLENVSVIDVDGVDMSVVVDNSLVVWYPSVVGNVEDLSVVGNFIVAVEDSPVVGKGYVEDSFIVVVEDLLVEGYEVVGNEEDPLVEGYVVDSLMVVVEDSLVGGNDVNSFMVVVEISCVVGNLDVEDNSVV